MMNTISPAVLQRLARYGSDTKKYTLASIADEDQASQVELEDILKADTFIGGYKCEGVEIV